MIVKRACTILWATLIFNQIYIDTLVVSADTGNWGPWSSWSGCVDSCEILLASRSRSCVQSSNHEQSTKTCQGAEKQYRRCNTTQCSTETYDPRTLECDKQMHVPFRGRRYHWKPYINKDKPCEVTCQSSHYGFYTGFGRPLKDGTDCGDERNPAVCLHGKCQTVGCDGVVGSGLRNDHCGVCGGDNEMCRIIAGIYTRSTLDYGYNHVTRIPAGACHINVTELARSRNYLVLKYSNGTGVINSDRTMMKRPGQYLAAGTMFSYGKQAGNYCPGECFYAPGPINTDIDIQLLTYRRNTGIRYMFAIPKDQINSVLKSYSSSTNSRSQNGHSYSDTQTSGLATETIYSNSEADRVRTINSNVGTDAVRKISYETEPQYVSPENGRSSSTGNQALESGYHGTQDAINRYRQGYGYQDRTSNDIANVYERNLLTQELRSSNLPPSTGYDVPTVAKTNRIPDTGNSDSVHSTGTRDQTNPRIGVRYPYGNEIDTGQSQLYVPDTIDEVNFRWTISGFTECSASCGGGRQETKSVCMKRNTNVIVTDDNCDPAKKNVQTIVCNKHPCPPDWESEPWSVCSRTCGEGIQTRKVECRQRYSQNYSIPITASLCNLVAKPETSRSCQVKPCAEWRTGNWSKCSAECGIGQVSRTVECVDTEDEVVSDQECGGGKPSGLKACDMGTCAKGWFMTSWSEECSEDCGRGYRYRTVYCSAEDGSPLPESKCGRQPRTRRSCKNKTPCGGIWFTGPWSSCSATCGTAVQTRDVVCMKKLEKEMFALVKDENCKGRTKPETEQPCPSLPECPPEWFMTKWSQCTQTCGGGIKARDVKCLDVNKTPTSQCSTEDKPSLRRTCNTQDCDLPLLNEDPKCKDAMNQCRYVVQAGLCQYEYYKQLCCHSCTLHHLRHKQQKEHKQEMTGS